jgi:hypothetical protein
MTPEQIAQLADFTRHNPQWSVFWDKRYRVFRVTEDNPDSDLYEEDEDPDKVLAYMAAHATTP